MKKLPILLIVCFARFAFGSLNPDTLEGIWAAEGGKETEISFCKGIATSNMQIEDGVVLPLQVPYKVIGGNSGLFILEYQLLDDESFVLNVDITEDGIKIISMDCQSSPEVCKAGTIATYRTLSHQHPTVDTTQIVEGMKGLDFSAIEIQPLSYVYARACNEQAQ